MEIDLSVYGYSKTILELRTKKVTIRPIRREGGWVPGNHDSAFLNEGSARDYTVPSKPRGLVLVNPCPDFVQDKENKIDDWQALADELGLEHVRDLNPNTKKGYWMREAESTVRLDRNGKHLNLNQTRDFIEYLVLRSNSHLIARNWASRIDSGEFMFAIVEEGEEITDQITNLEKKKIAYQLFGKMDHSATKMKDFLYVYYLMQRDAAPPPRNATMEWLKNEIGKIIESNLVTYLDILNDEDYTLKLLIQRSVETGALLKDKHVYTLPGADVPIGVLDDVLNFLNDPKNQTVRMKLMNHVEEKAIA